MSIAAVVLWMSAIVCMTLAIVSNRPASLVPIGTWVNVDRAPTKKSGMMFMSSPMTSVSLAPVRVCSAFVVRLRFWISLLMRPT